MPANLRTAVSASASALRDRRRHGQAPVLDLHLLPAAVLHLVVTDQIQRVVNAEGERRAEVAGLDGTLDDLSVQRGV